MELNEGSTLGILGRSGSGKSVLINMLRGIKEYAPDSGEVIFNIAMCENKDCLHVETPSKAGEKCPECGFNFNYLLDCPYKISDKCIHTNKD